MNRLPPLEEYIPDQHVARMRPISEIYLDASRELLVPTPSVKLKRFGLFSTMTGGLRPFEFTILCGATGTGKTTFVANLSLDFVEQGIPHFVASVETGATDFVKRLISARARKDWNTGDAVPIEQFQSFDDECGEIFADQSCVLSLYDDRFSVEKLMADIAYSVRVYGCKVAMIDNLNFFMEVTKSNDQIVEMDRVIHELIIFCKRVNVHVLMVMHPKKTDSGRVVSEFDVKGSSTAVQEAHNVFLLNRPHPDLIKAGTAEANDREIMIAKMRRRGKFVGRRLLLQTSDGVSYSERSIV